MTESGRANTKRLSARELNQYLTCALCSGYLIDAVTITECFHSFCKSCFVSYLQKPMLVERAAALLDKCVGCPACLSPLSKPFDSVRKDSLLQSIVFKCIPHVYFSEAERRAAFTARGQRAEKGGGNSLSMGSMTEKPVYVVLDRVDMDDLRKRSKGFAMVGPESSHATLEVRDSSSNNNYKLQQDMSVKQDEHDGTRQTVRGRLHIRCSSRMPLATLKRFLTLKFSDEAVLFSGDELFDDPHRLAMPLGELIALHCCASVCGERMRSLFEIDPNSEFAHFYFTVL